MKTLRQALLFVVLIPLCAVGQQPSSSDITRLGGTVVDDATGDPISDAVVRGPVTATGIPILVRSTVTLWQMSYSLAHLPDLISRDD